MRPSFSNEYGGAFVLIEPGNNFEFSLIDPIFVGARPVTQVEWSSIMGSNPSKFKDGWSAGLRPVESVTWFDCQDYISELNKIDNENKLGLEGFFRLPTNDEWEFFAEQEPRPNGIILKKTLTLMMLPGMQVMLGQQHVKLAKNNRMNGGFMTYTATYLNGHQH